MGHTKCPVGVHLLSFQYTMNKMFYYPKFQGLCLKEANQLPMEDSLIFRFSVHVIRSTGMCHGILESKSMEEIYYERQDKEEKIS